MDEVVGASEFNVSGRCFAPYMCGAVMGRVQVCVSLWKAYQTLGAEPWLSFNLTKPSFTRAVGLSCRPYR